MLFSDSYADPDGREPVDARDRYIALASRVVREPISTHLVRITRHGRACYLVVDQAERPRDGGLVVASTKNGLRVRRFGPSTPIESVWGTIVWYLQQA